MAKMHKINNINGIYGFGNILVKWEVLPKDRFYENTLPSSGRESLPTSESFPYFLRLLFTANVLKLLGLVRPV